MRRRQSEVGALQHRGRIAWTGNESAFTVPVVFLVLPVTVLFALFPGLISIVSLAQ
jgi:hypothetical protein